MRRPQLLLQPKRLQLRPRWHHIPFDVEDHHRVNGGDTNTFPVQSETSTSEHMRALRSVSPFEDLITASIQHAAADVPIEDELSASLATEILKERDHREESLLQARWHQNNILLPMTAKRRALA
jgi:hypothetical protein